jgi:hypothetical protein
MRVFASYVEIAEDNDVEPLLFGKCIHVLRIDVTGRHLSLVGVLAGPPNLSALKLELVFH